MRQTPLQTPRHHVTGAIKRGEAVAITELPAQRMRRKITLTERQLDILHVAVSEAAASSIVVCGKLVTHDEYRGIRRALALLTPEE